MANITASQIDIEAEETERIGAEALERMRSALGTFDHPDYVRLFDSVTSANARYHLAGSAAELLLHVLDQREPLSADDIGQLHRVWERLGGQEGLYFSEAAS